MDVTASASRTVASRWMSSGAGLSRDGSRVASAAVLAVEDTPRRCLHDPWDQVGSVTASVVVSAVVSEVDLEEVAERVGGSGAGATFVVVAVVSVEVAMAVTVAEVVSVVATGATGVTGALAADKTATRHRLTHPTDPVAADSAVLAAEETGEISLTAVAAAVVGMGAVTEVVAHMMTGPATEATAAAATEAVAATVTPGRRAATWSPYDRASLVGMAAAVAETTTGPETTIHVSAATKVAGMRTLASCVATETGHDVQLHYTHTHQLWSIILSGGGYPRPCFPHLLSFQTFSYSFVRFWPMGKLAPRV